MMHRPSEPSWMYGGQVSDDGRSLVIGVSKDCDPVNLLFLLDLSSFRAAVAGGGQAAPVAVVSKFVGAFDYITNEVRSAVLRAPRILFVWPCRSKPRCWRAWIRKASLPRPVWSCRHAALASRSRERVFPILLVLLRIDLRALTIFFSFPARPAAVVGGSAAALLRSVTLQGSDYYFLTNVGAPRYRVIRLRLRLPFGPRCEDGSGPPLSPVAEAEGGREYLKINTV